MALIGRLAEHSPDTEIAMILAKQGRRTATGLASTASRVAGIRERARIPAGPRYATDRDTGVSFHDAARQLGVCTQTIRRWLQEGLLPAEQTAPHAPWRIKLTDDIRRRFIPEVPGGYVRLADVAARTGLANAAASAYNSSRTSKASYHRSAASECSPCHREATPRPLGSRAWRVRARRPISR